jgi:hypothetical protein
MSCDLRVEVPRSRSGADALRRAALVCSLACAACVPLLPHTYYRPAASSGLNPINHCWKTAEEIRFPRGVSEVAVRIVQPDKAHAFVQLTLSLPEGHRGRFTRGDIVMTDAAGGRRALGFEGVARDERIDAPRMPIDSLLEGQTFATTPAVIARHYWLLAPIALDDVARFSIALPPLSIDDEVVVLPTIEFARTTEWQALAPLQC